MRKGIIASAGVGSLPVAASMVGRQPPVT